MLTFVNYFRLFRELHQEASSKKGKASVSLSADISSALDGIRPTLLVYAAFATSV